MTHEERKKKFDKHVEHGRQALVTRDLPVALAAKWAIYSMLQDHGLHADKSFTGPFNEIHTGVIKLMAEVQAHPH